MSIRRASSRGDSGAALPLVIFMTIMLALLIGATAMLTQSMATTMGNHARESSKRSAMVSWALHNAIHDLTPASGRLLGVDPRIDPGGSCVGQLGPYTDTAGRTINVECVQATQSGFGSSTSSLMLVGDGSDCGTSCVTGQDGGLRLTSNDPLTFSGGLINLVGAWQGKTANSKILNPTTAQSSVLQPDSADCPAVAGNFVSSPTCACPLAVADASKCYRRSLAMLRSDVLAYVRGIGAQVAVAQPSGVAQIPSNCSGAARLDPADVTSPWALTITGGTVGPTELAKLNALTSVHPCIGNGGTKQAPALVITRVLRFQDSTAGSAMLPNTAPVDANTWTINSSSAVVIGGAPVTDAVSKAVVDCDVSHPGAMLQFAGSTYLRLTAGRLLLCPLTSGAAVFAAPAADSGAGWVWQGLRAEPIFATQYGQSSGEVVKAHGVVFAPAAHMRIDSQSNRTEVMLAGGTVMRALTLTSNPSAIAQGDFHALVPNSSGTREVQLRFWDVARNRDLGFVQLVISDTYPSNPGTGYAFKVWRTMW